MTAVAPLPMFPLGGVLVPTMTLPLHVFEPRYRALVKTCLAGDGEFGVVLIERGSEVGGGDVRSGVGTVARIFEASELPDGRWVVGAVGMRRVRVRQWLDDAPYPCADLEDWPDPPMDADDMARATVARKACVAALRRALALQAELGEAGPPATVEVADDPVVASHHLTALAPVGPLDRQALLGAASVPARLTEIARLLAEATTDLELRMGLT